MPVKLQIAVSRASLKFLWGRTGAVVRASRFRTKGRVEAQFVVTDLEQSHLPPAYYW